MHSRHSFKHLPYDEPKLYSRLELCESKDIIKTTASGTAASSCTQAAMMKLATRRLVALRHQGLQSCNTHCVIYETQGNALSSGAL